MSAPAFASILATLLGLGLSVWLFVSSSTMQVSQESLQEHQQDVQNQQMLVQTAQQKVQAQQEQIQSANVLTQQVGPQVLQDLAKRAVNNKNEKIRALLAKHNLNIQDKPEAAKGTPGVTSAPAASSKP